MWVSEVFWAIVAGLLAAAVGIVLFGLGLALWVSAGWLGLLTGAVLALPWLVLLGVESGSETERGADE
jgi:hypothetical protein